MRRRNRVLLASSFLLLVGILGFVLATAPSWISGSLTTNYTTVEGAVYYHDFSANISGYNNDVNFTINTLNPFKIYLTNSTGRYEVSESFISPWIRIVDADTGNLTINATFDNQSGYFEIPIQATNTTGTPSGITDTFYFIVNATNDAPTVDSVNATYNITESVAFSAFLNASDEEEHYPLYFNLTFDNSSCTHADWSGLSDDTFCDLKDFGFNVTALNNVSAKINFTAAHSHVGVYIANLTVIDFGENFNSSAQPYQEANYSLNRTSSVQQIVFNVFSTLQVNATACQNQIFNESYSGLCNVTIYTKEANDTINISTYGILRNYASGQSDVSNTSWFYPNVSTNVTPNYQYIAQINVTPTKIELGNWTINFSVADEHGNSVTEQIYVFVNRTLPDAPDLVFDTLPSANTTSINQVTTINLSMYDDDFLIPDKDYFNETATFTVAIVNQSNPLETLTLDTLNSSTVRILAMPVSGTNRTTAGIRFTPASDEGGNYTITISVNDSENLTDSVTFNLTIIDNTVPVWNSPVTTFFLWENNATSLNLSQNVTDFENDSLTFYYSFVDGKTFSSFSLTSVGIVDFTARDSDVGGHLVNITVGDGYLNTTRTFNFTFRNVEDLPVIRFLGSTNATPTTNVANGSTITGTEDNYTTIFAWVEDDDLRIPSSQKSFYNESFTFSSTILGPNTSLLNFSLNDGWWPEPDSAPTQTLQNRTRYDAIFTPRKADVGDYNVTLNVSDGTGNFYEFVFYVTINSINHDPVLSTLLNQSTAVNRTLYYDLNVTDTEDGNDTFGVNTNFTFSFTNLTGDDIFSSSFNQTTGILNLTFTDAQGGLYRVNVSVNDSSGALDYQDFWILVYGPPNVNLPSNGYIFNLTENSTSLLNFTVNHSVGDNLTYAFYVDSVTSAGVYGNSSLRYRMTSYGNGTNLTWSFTPNMTDETYNLLKNITLVVYPASANLTNATFVNTTTVFKANITHTNSPVQFNDNIDDQSSTYGSSITIDLSDHFSDDDYSDTAYNQTISFVLSGDTSSITSSIDTSTWILTLSATSAVSGTFNVTASDSLTSATSNNFDVTFTTPQSSSSTQSSSGGSSTREVPVSLKILMPDPVSVFSKDYIELPLTLQNDGTRSLYGIDLFGSVAYNGTLITEEVTIEFNKTEFSVLEPGEKEKVLMGIRVNTERQGAFEITVNATVTSPELTDWGKMYITVKEGESVREKILFTEEFIVENPECLELKELVDEAKRLMESGDTVGAVAKADEAVNACKDLIAQANRPVVKQIIEDPTYRYLVIATLVVFLGGIGFYSYKRMRFKRQRGSFIQETIKNRKYLEKGGGYYGR